MPKFVDWGALRQNFKDAVGGLPNYKRGMAFEFVNALELRITELEAEVETLAENKVRRTWPGYD